MPITRQGKRIVQDAVDAVADLVEREPEPLTRAGKAHDTLALWIDCGQTLILLRTAAIRQAVQDGFTFADIALALDLSRQRVQQLAEMPPGIPGRRPASKDRSTEAQALRLERMGFMLDLTGTATWKGGTITLALPGGGAVLWERLDGDGGPVVYDGDNFRGRLHYRPPS